MVTIDTIGKICLLSLSEKNPLSVIPGYGTIAQSTIFIWHEMCSGFVLYWAIYIYNNPQCYTVWWKIRQYQRCDLLILVVVFVFSQVSKTDVCVSCHTLLKTIIAQATLTLNSKVRPKFPFDLSILKYVNTSTMHLKQS